MNFIVDTFFIYDFYVLTIIFIHLKYLKLIKVKFIHLLWGIWFVERIEHMNKDE